MPSVFPLFDFLNPGQWGSSIETCSADHLLYYEFTKADCGNYDLPTSLSEQGIHIATGLKLPSHALKQFFYAALHVLDDKIWTFEYSRENREMHFDGSNLDIVATQQATSRVRIDSFFIQMSSQEIK